MRDAWKRFSVSGVIVRTGDTGNRFSVSGAIATIRDDGTGLLFQV